MATIVVCSCGAKLKATEKHAGKSVPCPKCKQPTAVPAEPKTKIPVKCACGKSFAAKAQLAGKTVKCPACEKPITIPTPGTAGSKQADDPLGIGDLTDDALFSDAQSTNSPVRNFASPQQVAAGNTTNATDEHEMHRVQGGGNIVDPVLKSKCPTCGGGRCSRIVHKSVRWIGLEYGATDEEMESHFADGHKEWFWIEAAICLKCAKTECAVKDCAEHADTSLVHYFRIGDTGTIFWRSHGVQVRNDLPVCSKHANSIRLFRYVRLAGIALGVLGLILCFVGVMSPEYRVLSLVLGVPSLIAGISGFAYSYILASSNKLFKKDVYIERVPAPGIHSDMAWSGPWTDDGFTTISMGKPQQ